MEAARQSQFCDGWESHRRKHRTHDRAEQQSEGRQMTGQHPRRNPRIERPTPVVGLLGVRGVRGTSPPGRQAIDNGDRPEDYERRANKPDAENV